MMVHRESLTLPSTRCATFLQGDHEDLLIDFFGGGYKPGYSNRFRSPSIHHREKQAIITMPKIDGCLTILSHQAFPSKTQRSRLSKYWRRSARLIATARAALSCFSAVVAYWTSISNG